MRRLAPLAAAVLLVGCVSALEIGDERKREGDLLGALESWRSIPRSSSEHAAAKRRIARAETEHATLAARYRQRGDYYRERERLAESVLNYRLALQLAPDDRASLDRVQQLSRELAARKRTHRKAFEAAFGQGRLAVARREMKTLRMLDPFDPDVAASEQALRHAFEAEVESRLARGRQGFFAGDYASADAAFRSVLELEPRNESAQGYLVFIATMRDAQRRSGRKPAVLRPPNFAASDAEIRAEGFYQNALAADRSGDPYAALRYDLAAVASNPAHRGARNHMDELRRRLSPRVPQLIESGRQAFVQEDLETALDRWRRALLIDPANEQAREYADRAELMLANLERLRAEPSVAAGAP